MFTMREKSCSLSLNTRMLSLCYVYISYFVLIVPVPDHCLHFTFEGDTSQ